MRTVGIFGAIVWTAFSVCVQAAQGQNFYDVLELKRSDASEIRIYSRDRKRYLVNKEDEKGIAQVYVGWTGGSELTCITDKQQPGGPKPDRFKMQPQWHPSGKWIFMAVERDEYSTPPILGNDRNYVEGMLQCGLWTNMYAVTPDGKKWHRLTDFSSAGNGVPDGYTGPAFTSDGKKAVWSQIVNGNIFQYTFGKWELIIADVEELNGAPTLRHHKNITPEGMHWNEPGNFAPDNVTLLLTGSVEKDAHGQDQYLLNIKTGDLKNLTNSPTVWDEHGVFSPDGSKIIFMSAHPYRADPGSSRILSIRTEFMMMNRDGSELTQLTRFCEPGAPEYDAKRRGIAACAYWNPDGRSVSLTTLVFPNYDCWTLTFRGSERKRYR
jgi:Tol biopolymer transport system component